MIEITFFDFHEHDYKYDRYCLYVMKNGSGGILYVGISTNDVWVRWFGWGGHLMWDGNVIYGESTIGEKIENHLPESLRWKIQLWTLEDCQKYCGQEIAVADSAKTFEEYKQAILDIEPFMIRKIRPALNKTYNLRPGKDTTPKSEKEKKWDRYVDEAYDEIFNKKD
jgi:hypothetical protein